MFITRGELRVNRGYVEIQRMPFQVVQQWDGNADVVPLFFWHQRQGEA